MDRTEVYIKMINHPDIQNSWIPADGDFCWHDNAGEEMQGVYEFPEEFSIVAITKARPKSWWLNWLWLPTQDKLQEMVKRPIPNLLLCIRRQWNEMQFPNLPTSMEQLWIAFVMKEKYNKVWTGEEWRDSS